MASRSTNRLRGHPGSSAIGEAVAGYLQAIGLQVSQQIVDYQTVVRPQLKAAGTADHCFVYEQKYYQDVLQALQIANEPLSTFQAYN